MTKKFIDLVKEIAADNGIPMKPVKEIDYDWLNVEMLDKQSARLSDAEAYVFTCGERLSAERIKKLHGIDELDRILNRIFDGDLYDNFYYT